MNIENFDYEQTVMNIIVNAGACRSYAMQALGLAKAGHFDDAMLMMEQASEALKQAHEVQTQLIGLDEGTGKVPVHLIMVHAQDHLMNAILLKDLAAEFIDIYQKLSAWEA
ncbi:N,N'-diacetylchitobiose-specific enzyme IIA component of PTS [Serratia proteamaculans]|uniref:PTS lactose/cellobiose transporter subunit IIA n=1 Tax=Serratia proteamaculans TaxID=28151 RepID=UPI0009F7B797|nr:PTS lactose/cellobiose transporter subunit IIA [Serratia proteamaculans]SMB57092.1 N,N'-diacetylchitobiose-specific enzyme IIA component of PTS [Serratia proteamaculans]